MSDPHVLLKEILGWAASVQAHHDEVMANLALLRAGHPRAQDFEPSGHGGSDPTAQNGIRPDTAVAEGRRYDDAIRQMHKYARVAEDISYRQRNAVRPERKKDDLDDFWCVLHLAQGSQELRKHLDLCDTCYRFKCTHGRYPTPQEVDYRITYRKWPPRLSRIDPTKPRVDVMRIASVDRLQLHAASMTAEQAADILTKKD